MDLTVEAEALGMEIKFDENESPSVIGHGIKTSDDLNALSEKWHGSSCRMKVFVDVVKEMSQNFSIMKGAYVIGPFTLAGELTGVTDLTMNVILQPQLVHKFLDFSIKVISDYTNALFEAGADTVCVLEPTAMMVSTDQFQKFSVEPLKKILENIDPVKIFLNSTPEEVETATK